MRRIEDGDANAKFTCRLGPAQVGFLKSQAVPAERSNHSRTYVLVGDGTTSVMGFYAICMGRVTTADLPNTTEKDSRLGTPAALLAQLARDDDAPQGTGAQLMVDALQRIVKLSREIGCCGAVLHAETDKLVPYYEKFGFETIGKKDAPKPRMWVSVKDLEASFQAAAT